MKAEEIIKKYQEGTISSVEMEMLEKMIEEGLINIEELDGLSELRSDIMKMEDPEPSEAMTFLFQEKLKEKIHKTNAWSFKSIFELWPQSPVMKLAYSVILIVAGVFIGRVGGNQGHNELTSMRAEMSEMKEMMMFTLLEKESTRDRLKAVSLSQEMDQASNTVIEALLNTLNNDDNVNVRLAALEALYPYASNPDVRVGLISSISQQESPMVQVALSEVMVALQEKRSVPEFQELLKSERTPQEVKNQIQKSIKTLI